MCNYIVPTAGSVCTGGAAPAAGSGRERGPGAESAVRQSDVLRTTPLWGHAG